MKRYAIINYDILKRNNRLNSYLINQMIRLLNETNTYDEINKLLINNSIKMLVINEYYEIIGLLLGNIYLGYKSNILFCQGIYLRNECNEFVYQDILYQTVRDYNPDLLVTKMSNPKDFESFTKIPQLINYYPNIYSSIPKDILRLIRKCLNMNDINKYLVIKDYYSCVQHQKCSNNNDINKIFINNGEYDAQIFIGVLHNIKAKKKILKKDKL